MHVFFLYNRKKESKQTSTVSVLHSMHFLILIAYSMHIKHTIYWLYTKIGNLKRKQQAYLPLACRNVHTLMIQKDSLFQK